MIHTANHRRSYLLTLLLLTLGYLTLISVTTAQASHTPNPTAVTIAGSLQSELGCPGDWQPECTTTQLAYDSVDTVWQGSWTVPSGYWEYKAALDNSWNENYGANAIQNGPNIGLNGNGGVVKFYYDHGTHWITSNYNAAIATAAGDFQSELGCPGDWQPDCLRSWLQDPDGDGIYTFSTTNIPAGNYSVKVAINEGWAENYGQDGVPGGANIQFSVPSDARVYFNYNATTHILTVTSSGGGAAHDNNVFWDDLGHDSRDLTYRSPGGAVTTNTPVTLQLQAASGDLTAAKVRVWNDRLDNETLLDMTLVADDGVHEWWQATIPASVDPTVYWYRFIAIDGTATAYYEDDSAHTGGSGQTYGSSPDNSWQLTVYDPSFHTPDWVKNGIIYQIFPDRFRDGDASNDTLAGSFYYDLPDGSIYRSNGSDWNTPLCDPRDAGTCFQKYGENFYGGDLQGVIDKLDYLQDLGVTVIYLNPIFESPSNHKYDTTDFSVIDDAFGDLAVFQTLTTEAHNRGMYVVLDGVFNHTSSDSVYFDRYGRYGSVGACESTDSPYRSWYYFFPAAPGTGVCDGDTNYESWFGYDSLPKMDGTNAGVRDLIWAGGSNSIAQYWMQWADGWRLDVGGDVDPGTIHDPNNDYWEGFRDAVHAANPDAYIVGEEWGIAASWTLGTEWDATMNYQFSSAIMGFWRDTALYDNDHNAGSSAGVLAPMTPSQLNERLLNLEERYPPEAFQAMMNLLGSHDTNRALFLLDENASQYDDTLYDNPNYDWSDAMVRLQGVVLLQMTLPGAPTIYYGDEIGLVGPLTHNGSTWEDDPYNRIPYPWLDEGGSGYYTHLQSQAGQDTLLNYYTLLARTRNSHPALRTGSFDPLLVDDGNNVYVYGRLMADHSDAAVVIINRANGAQNVSVDVSGYLPVGEQFVDVLNGNAMYSVDGDGMLSVPNVPGRSGALLVLAGPVVPGTVSDLSITISRQYGDIYLTWSATSDSDSYNVYRKPICGGDYQLIGNTSETTYTDTDPSNAAHYSYVVVGLNHTSLLTSDYSNEAVGPQATQSISARCSGPPN